MIKINDPSNVKYLNYINNEEILYKAKVSNLLIFLPISMLLVSLFLLFKINLIFSGTLFSLNILCIFIVKLYVKNSFIYITPTKIHYYFGVFSNNSDILQLSKINKVEVRQSVFDMVCNTGNVFLLTNSGDRENFIFIENPKGFKTQINNLI